MDGKVGSIGKGTINFPARNGDEKTSKRSNFDGLLTPEVGSPV